MKSELSLMEPEEQYYAEMNRLHKLTGKTCDGYGCGFPGAQRFLGFGTGYCMYKKNWK